MPGGMVLLGKLVDSVLLLWWFIILPSEAAISGSRNYGISFHLLAYTWTPASKCCRSRNMDLVKIDSVEKAVDVADYSNGRPTIATQSIWFGLRAEDVRNYSTYSWADGTPFNETLVDYLPWNVTSLEESTLAGPQCFEMETLLSRIEIKPRTCTVAHPVVCELRDGYEHLEQKATDDYCPGWNNFLFKGASQDALATTSGASSEVTVRGRWERRWGTAMTRSYFKWSPRLAPVPEDCILLCLKHSPNAAGVQVETLGAINRMTVCSCLIPS